MPNEWQWNERVQKSEWSIKRVNCIEKTKTKNDLMMEEQKRQGQHQRKNIPSAKKKTDRGQKGDAANSWQFSTPSMIPWRGLPRPKGKEGRLRSLKWRPNRRSLACQFPRNGQTRQKSWVSDGDSIPL
ncbi:hypothetical protein ASPVEDRAFT_369898 [Aspergillus versicolor CBS 583.65]|uniref:Uncharacterized protein n=1 Tax=Aspergillus versicolor CBS 583.65 TaxID=1036611 RepID=A0A1L9Q1J1_ASPVE|nr:uncharacterized protein ASPVEDRAFT_369898 [Aspergillus versicolor CBS 583.65]OJJ07562.1 hypothetical protein ASPVEDRAFT_369898 [Aspergillus versicolor CBS 583.65]